MTQRIDLLALGSIPSPNDIDEIGVTQTTGRRLLWELQQAVVTLQEAALRAAAKERTATTSDLTLKDYRLRKVQTLFGTVSLRVPRLVNQGRIESVLPTSCGARSTREFDDLRNKLSVWLCRKLFELFLCLTMWQQFVFEGHRRREQNHD
ncbi:hypothetical protein [Thalassobacter stenotrophicus]|uniref:hypothetical protein n=1 Tax=Thalassobacter stenotrophicus TaxID=266809 RepID=UPI001114731F|nr:hypothetical protein [Thalassobacter stenotrophicus]